MLTFLDPESLASLLALVALEIVLGIDNIVFIAIMVGRLPEHQRKLGYRLGLGGAVVTRVLLLLTLAWIVGLKEPWFHLLGKGFSGRDLVLIGGGLFLLYKASQEVFEKVEGQGHSVTGGKPVGLWSAVGQIMVIDIIFSLDSVITAVGIAPALWVMVTAIIVAVAVMMVFAQSIGNFIGRNPSMQVLALSFLLLIGVLLVADGFGQKVSKGYVYFAMGFSLLVELLNLRYRNRRGSGPLDRDHLEREHGEAQPRPTAVA